MNLPLRTLLAIALLALGVSGVDAEAARPGTLRIATWNMEWLIAPEDFPGLARTCVPRDVALGPRKRSIPCNTAQELERSTLDFTVIERYVRQLDADVIALQEVDGVAAAR
jgi:hypothetical protein